MNMQNISLIGAGVIGETLISAFTAAGVAPESIAIVEKRAERVDELTSKYKVRSAELVESVSAVDLVLLVVKPQDMGALLQQISGKVNPAAIVVSLAAGISTKTIENALGEVAVIRVMPNTPAVINKGMFVASKGAHCDQAQFDQVLNLLRPSGSVLEVAEVHQDAVTALSGSGPAYVFLVAEALQAAGEKLGLAPDVARELTVQTIYGSAQMLRDGVDAAEARQRVTSPKGTTAAALDVLEERELRKAFDLALKAARDRSVELAEQSGG